MKEFADNLSMTVDRTKTKIVMFPKGGFISAKEVWWYGANTIEVVDRYKYLGLHFTTKLSLTRITEELASKATARLAQILKCLRRLGNVQRNVFFKLFDAQVPVLMYGSETWGTHQLGDIEKVHMFACKRFLNTGMKTPNKMVLGDLGRYPMYTTYAVQCIKYWFRIIIYVYRMKCSPKKHIGCYCIRKVLAKRPGHTHIRSDNCCA